MKINSDNYESYAIDYIDGKLSTQEVAEFMAFLAEFPEIEAEVQNLQLSIRDTKQIIFQEKNLLKKEINHQLEINPANLEEFCIAYYEGDLNSNAELHLEQYIKKNPEAKKTFTIYGYAKASVDQKIVYKNKPALKKKSAAIQRKLIVFSLSTAASILFISALFLFWPSDSNKTSEEIARLNSSENLSVTEYPKLSEHEEYRKEVIGAAIKQRLIAIKPDETTPEIVPDEIPKLAIVEPISIKIPDVSTPEVNLTSAYQKENTRIIQENAYTPHKTSPGKRSVKFIRLIQASIKGMNKLTEGSMVLDTETNEQGKIKSLALNTETFRIKKNFKSEDL